VVRFLKHLLLRQLAGKVVVVWDGSPLHRAKAVKEFLLEAARLPGLGSNGAARLCPGIEPELEDLKASEVSGAKERVLPEPIRAEVRVAQGQGAAQAQGSRHP
jgi:hypothetical protein